MRVDKKISARIVDDGIPRRRHLLVLQVFALLVVSQLVLVVRYSEEELPEEAVDRLRLLGFTFATKHGGGAVAAAAAQCEVVASVFFHIDLSYPVVCSSNTVNSRRRYLGTLFP